MVGDDDEVGFGDFKLASSNQNVHSTSTMINGPDFTATFNNANDNKNYDDNDDDDDWGDFVNSGGSGVGGLSHTISLPGTSKPLDPFGFSADQTQNGTKESFPPGSAPSRFISGTAIWEKPKGALPLSIFGDVEEEEGSVTGDSSFGEAGSSSFFDEDKNSGKKGSGLNVNDLIANLYKQSEPANGSSPDSNGSMSDSNGSNSVDKMNKIDNKSDLNMNASNLGGVHSNSSLKPLHLNWNWVNSDVNGLDTNGGNEKKSEVKGLNPGLNVLNLNKNEFSLIENFPNSFEAEANSSTKEVNSGTVDGIEGLDDDDDDNDDGWEFKVAESKATEGDEISKTDKIKTDNGQQESNLNGFSSSWNSLGWDFEGWNSNANETISSANWLNIGSVDENGKLGEADGWEFKAADGKIHVVTENSKDGQTNAENVSSLALSGSDSSWDMLPSDSNGSSSNVMKENSNPEQLNPNVDLYDKGRGFDDADGWGFKGAEPELQVINGNSKGDQLKTQNGVLVDPNGHNMSWNFLSLDGGGMVSKLNGMDLDMKQVDTSLHDDDDQWDFKTAGSESGPGDQGTKGNEIVAEDSERALPTFAIGNGTHSTGNLIFTSQGTSHNSGEWNFGFDFNPSFLVQDSTVSAMYSKSEENDKEITLPFPPIDENVGSEGNSLAFKDAFSDNVSVNKEKPSVSEDFSAVESFTLDGNIQGNNMGSDSQKGALPLSFFGEKEKEADDAVIFPDISTQMNGLKERDSFKNPHLKTSINDLISNLYSQAEQNKSVTTSDLANGDDDFDDNSWEFNYATTGNRSEDQTSILDLEKSHETYSVNELDDYISFFTKLKDELHNFAVFHHEDLKKARSAAALSGKDAEVQVLDEEIEGLQNCMSTNGVSSDARTPTKISLNEFVEVLQEPKFREFDSEYRLSKKLSTVEDNFGSAIELLKHLALILKILTLVSFKEQFAYVFTWSKMVSTCAQELKHGAYTWKQSLQKNVDDQILSELRGMKYIVALGEIFRVVEILKLSARAYKPWILANHAENLGLTALLNECFTLWSSSGLGEALERISGEEDFGFDERIKALLESIKFIQDIDELTLHSHISSGQNPICRLSALTAGLVPGMQNTNLIDL
uniref:Uncharacterized protein LOC105134166 n=1 Tax=Rhizophora mucronata TaxID=61149 RepID=A0A2P2JNB7_RHIMU